MHRLFILSFCSFYLEANIKKPLHILAKRVIYMSQMRLRSSEVFATSGSAERHIYPASESVSLELHSSLVVVSARRKLHSLLAAPVCTVTKREALS